MAFNTTVDVTICVIETLDKFNFCHIISSDRLLLDSFFLHFFKIFFLEIFIIYLKHFFEIFVKFLVIFKNNLFVIMLVICGNFFEIFLNICSTFFYIFRIYKIFFTFFKFAPV